MIYIPCQFNKSPHCQLKAEQCSLPGPSQTSRSYTPELKEKRCSQCKFQIYLGVKGVTLQLIFALDVSLVHGQSVVGSLKDLGFVNFVKSTPGEVSIPTHRHKGHPFPVHSQSRNLLLVGVFIKYQRKPKHFDVFIRESI